MPPDVGIAAKKSKTAELLVLVLLCRDLESSVPGLELGPLSVRLSSLEQGIQVRIVDGLCSSPVAIGDSLRRVPATRLVLGLCSGVFSEVGMQAHARRAGLDPLGIQHVELGPPCRAAVPGPSAKAEALLAAAVARARAFPGSRPENVKSTFAPLAERVSRRALFMLPPVTYQSVPTIDFSRCAATEGCTQCLQACPHEALEQNGNTIVVSRNLCRGCGVCLTACPQRAVELPGWSPEEIEAQVSALLRADLPSRNLLFLCKKAPLPEGDWLPVRMPCVAMVSVAAILQSLAHGATTVALGQCGKQCPTGQDETVGGRIDYCQQLLQLLGGTPERARVVGPATIAPAPPSITSPPPFAAAASSDSIHLFASEAAAQALDALASHMEGSGALRLEHPSSPLGLVEIDPKACTGCGACAGVCPTSALSFQRQGEEMTIRFNPRLCTACGQCVLVCPEASARAIRTDRVTDLARLARGKVPLYQDVVVLCQGCGAPVATKRMLTRIKALLGDGSRVLAEHTGRYCASCKETRELESPRPAASDT